MGYVIVPWRVWKLLPQIIRKRKFHSEPFPLLSSVTMYIRPNSNCLKQLTVCLFGSRWVVHGKWPSEYFIEYDRRIRAGQRTMELKSLSLGNRKIIESLTLKCRLVKSCQIIAFHQPGYPWNKGISLTKPRFGVRSCEVAIIWPGNMIFLGFQEGIPPESRRLIESTTWSTWHSDERSFGWFSERL